MPSVRRASPETCFSGPFGETTLPASFAFRSIDCCRDSGRLKGAGTAKSSGGTGGCGRTMIERGQPQRQVKGFEKCP